MEIKYWKAAKVPTVQYGSEDVCITLTSDVPAEEVQKTYSDMKNFVDERIAEQVNAIGNKLSSNDYREKDGKRYPRVSKILSPDPINIPNIEKYALRGSAYHEIGNTVLLGGDYDRAFTEVSAKYDISPIKWTDIKAKEFFEKFGKDIVVKELNVEVFNEKHLYSGEIDFVGTYLGCPCIADFKTGTWKLEQLVAYAKTKKEYSEYDLIIFDLKNAKVEAFAHHEPPVQEAWEKFIFLRGKFHERFKI